MTARVPPIEVFDGVMLSDGSLRMHGHNANLSIQLSGAEHLDWLQLIKASLAELGMTTNKGHPKVVPAVSKGKLYERALLAFNTDPFFTKQYKRWYKDGIKVLPSDIQLTPVSVAHFYMGDGCASYKYFKSAPNSVFVSAAFCTDNFAESEVDVLVDQLHSLDITRAIKQKATGNFEVYVSEAGSVCALMDMVEPYIVPSLQYKIKRPTLAQKKIRRNDRWQSKN